MRVIEAFLDLQPPRATAQHKGVRVLRKRTTKKMVVRFFKKADLQIAEAQLRIQLERHAPPEPMTGPLKLTVTWTFYWFLYELPDRRDGKLPQWIASIGWPDCDNVYKLFGDVLTSLKFWKDDSHVSCLTIRKGRGDRPGIHFRLEPYVVDYVPPEADIIEEIEL